MKDYIRYSNIKFKNYLNNKYSTSEFIFILFFKPFFFIIIGLQLGIYYLYNNIL